MLMMKKPKNLEFEPLYPKNVLLASVVHGISCLFAFGCVTRCAAICCGFVNPISNKFAFV
jgi:hypothetical protein